MITDNSANKPWLNPSKEQEMEWKTQRQVALVATRQAVEAVLQLTRKTARQQYLQGYRNKHGDVCADALEHLVKSAWDKRRAGII